MQDTDDLTLAELEEHGKIDGATAILCEHFLGDDWRALAVSAALDAVRAEPLAA
jgi:hypothetical protein